MKKIASDIVIFFQELELSDIIFFAAVIALIILIVVVIYFIKSSDMEEEDEKKEKIDNKPVDKLDVIEKIDIEDDPIAKLEEEIETMDEEEEFDTDEVLVSTEDLLGLIADDDEEDVLPPAEDEPDELIDLKTITEALENNTYPIDVEALNAYEDDQEDKAIISYDELLEKTGNLYKINYEEESLQDGLSVKKINVDNIATPTEELHVNTKTDLKLISYDQEEEFLTALKDLQKMLN